MTANERKLLRRAQRETIVNPPTKAFLDAARRLVNRGFLVERKNGYEITIDGKTANANEPHCA